MVGLYSEADERKNATKTLPKHVNKLKNQEPLKTATRHRGRPVGFFTLSQTYSNQEPQETATIQRGRPVGFFSQSLTVRLGTEVDEAEGAEEDAQEGDEEGHLGAVGDEVPQLVEELVPLAGDPRVPPGHAAAALAGVTVMTGGVGRRHLAGGLALALAPAGIVVTTDGVCRRHLSGALALAPGDAAAESFRVARLRLQGARFRFRGSVFSGRFRGGSAGFRRSSGGIACERRAADRAGGREKKRPRRKKKARTNARVPKTRFAAVSLLSFFLAVLGVFGSSIGGGQETLTDRTGVDLTKGQTKETALRPALERPCTTDTCSVSRCHPLTRHTHNFIGGGSFFKSRAPSPFFFPCGPGTTAEGMPSTSV